MPLASLLCSWLRGTQQPSGSASGAQCAEAPPGQRSKGRLWQQPLAAAHQLQSRRLAALPGRGAQLLRDGGQHRPHLGRQRRPQGPQLPGGQEGRGRPLHLRQHRARVRPQGQQRADTSQPARRPCTTTVPRLRAAGMCMGRLPHSRDAQLSSESPTSRPVISRTTTTGERQPSSAAAAAAPAGSSSSRARARPMCASPSRATCAPSCPGLAAASRRSSRRSSRASGPSAPSNSAPAGARGRQEHHQLP
jgi:hypothetical protein